jgi:hypothetical protein
VAWVELWLNEDTGGLDFWPPITKAGSDTLAATGTDASVTTKADAQQLFPDAILTQTNIGGAVGDIDEDPDSPDANWMAGTGAVVLRVSFPTPTANLKAGFTQEFRVRARPGT